MGARRENGSDEARLHTPGVVYALIQRVHNVPEPVLAGLCVSCRLADHAGGALRGLQGSAYLADRVEQRGLTAAYILVRSISVHTKAEQRTAHTTTWHVSHR